MNLTPKQLNLLRWIEAFIQEHKYAPTLDEIAKSLGVSKITALQHLRALEKRGAIRRKRYQTRSIEIVTTSQPGNARTVPVTGRIQPGGRIVPLPAGEYLNVAAELANLSEAFVLRVEGAALEAGEIRDGDYVICAARPPKAGDMVVAVLTDGSWGIVRMSDEDGASLAPGKGDAGNAPENFVPKIQAVVTGLFRKY